MLRDYNETSFTRISGDGFASIYSSERQMMNRVRQLGATRPDEVQILVDTEEGVLAHVPANWLKLVPSRKVTLSDEEKAKRAERMRAMKGRSK